MSRSSERIGLILPLGRNSLSLDHLSNALIEDLRPLMKIFSNMLLDKKCEAIGHSLSTQMKLESKGNPSSLNF